MTPTPEQIAAALEHAGRCQPLESCGVIVDDGAFIAIANRADEQGHFIMDRRAFCRIDVERKVRAIVHSHVHHPAMAGEQDRAMCEKTGLPWVIVSWPTGHHCVIEPDGTVAPLVGREWQWGAHDCYSIVRDGFHAFTGILIPDYDRDWMFWKEGGDDIGRQFHETGFVSIPLGSQPLQCDVFGMNIGSPVVNHLALFLAPDRILHQLYRRLSVRELYGGIYREKTTLHLRHERFL